MAIVSFVFPVFFAVVALIHYLLPGRFRYIWLFAAGMAFYASQGPVHTAFLLFSVLTTYAGALLLEQAGEKTAKKRGILAAVLACNLGMLLFFKYIGFFSGGHLTSPILPVGISFYTFQAAGYLIDVYYGRVQAEKNPVRYGLFVSFFPTVLSGPIERAGHLLTQFSDAHLTGITWDGERIRAGLVRMLWGYFNKMVLADHLAIAVNTVYTAPEQYGGAVLFLTSVLYSLQIYFDFAGYSSIAIGAAQVLGLEIAENFDAPYLAKGIGDFWRRWHISLSSWFRDYLYIPLGGNRRGLARKVFNILVVMILSGLWHGAGWTFLIWGLIHGICQAVRALVPKLPKSRVITFLFVNLAWIFFRMDTVSGALAVIRGFAVPKPWELTDGTLLLTGLNPMQWQLVVAGILLVFAADALRTFRGVRLSAWLMEQHIAVRWLICIAGIVVVLTCGVWGPGYDATQFIYYQF